VETAIRMDEARTRIDELLNRITADPEKIKKLLALLD
jgi:hypothetical protein